MRVWLPTTPAGLGSWRTDGVPVGTEGYAVTDALADALGLARPSPEDRDTDGVDGELLEQAVLEAAAEHSLLLLAEELVEESAEELVEESAEESAERSAREVDEEDGAHPATDDGRDPGTATAGRAARRAVVVVRARARPVDDAAHPATVVLLDPVPWSSVDCVLADDASAAGRVRRAAVLAAADQDAAVARLERDQLGWFGRDEPQP